jgi:hypothetical protein
MKTEPGRFQSSEIGQWIVFRAGRRLLGVQFRDFDAFPALRRGYAPFFSCPANESAKRFAGDIEADLLGEPLPDFLVCLSRAQHDFDFRQKGSEESGLRRGWFIGKLFQGLAVEISS